MTTVKITKKDNFTTLRKCVSDHADWFEPGEASRLLEFIDHEVELLDKRAVSAKKYAKKTSKAEDELASELIAILNSNKGAMTIPDILAALPEDCGATAQKLTYRLSALVNDNIVIKDQVSIKEEGKPARRINCYSFVETSPAE